MNLDLVAFNTERLRGFVYNGVESEFAINGDIIGIAEYYAKLGPVRMINAEGVIVGVCGMYKLWGTWGGAWLFLNKEARKYKIEFYKKIREEMNNTIRRLGIEILTVQCLNNSREANNLLSHLGFVKDKEFKMAIYGRKT